MHILRCMPIIGYIAIAVDRIFTLHSSTSVCVSLLYVRCLALLILVYLNVVSLSANHPTIQLLFYELNDVKNL